MKKILLIIYNIYVIVILVCVILPILVVIGYGISIIGKLLGRDIFITKGLFFLFKALAHLFCFSVGIFYCNEYLNGASIKQTCKQQTVYIANHLSYFDSVLILLSISKCVRPLGKFEVSKMPILGYLYAQYVITVNRSNMQSKIDSLKNIQHTLEKQIDVLLFPEGTFKEKPTMRVYPFQDGAFKTAISQKCLLQPLVFLYTQDRFSFKTKFLLTPGKLKVIYLPVIDASLYSIEQSNELKQDTYEKILSVLNQYDYPRIS